MPAEHRKRKGLCAVSSSVGGPPTPPSKKNKCHTGDTPDILADASSEGAKDNDTANSEDGQSSGGKEKDATISVNPEPASSADDSTSLTLSGSDLGNADTDGVATDGTVGSAAGQSDAVFLDDLTGTPRKVQDHSADQENGDMSAVRASLAAPSSKNAYSTLLLARIASFEGFAGDPINTYAIRNLPIQSGWGTRRVNADMSDTLCRASSNRPVTLWVVGKVRQTYFKDREGTPYNQVAIHVEPYNKDTLDSAGALLRRLSNPSEQAIEDSYGYVRASCWQTSNLAGYRNAPASPFEEVYDARVAFADKTDMQMYDPDTLKYDDLVLVEMSVGRYRIREDGEQTPKKSKGIPGWVKYKATFNLISVSLLHSAPSAKRPPMQTKKTGIVI